MSKLKVEIKTKSAGLQEYLVLEIWHHDKMIHAHSDLMEPEDVSFVKDLAWIPGLLEKVYKLGLEDGHKYIQGELF